MNNTTTCDEDEKAVTQTKSANKTKPMLAVTLLAGALLLLGPSNAYAVDGGHTVTVTDEGRLATYQANNGHGTAIIEYFEARLSIETRQVPTHIEAGASINWEWKLEGVRYTHDEVDATGYQESNLLTGEAANQTASVTGNAGDAQHRPGASLKLPLDEKARYNTQWQGFVSATASQTPNAAHPEGWTKTGVGSTSFHDVAPPPPPPNGGGGDNGGDGGGGIIA